MIKKKKITNHFDTVFFWNMMGSISTAAISVLLLIIVSRYLTTLKSDVFSFSYAFGNMIIVLATFQIRNYQASDLVSKFEYKNYFQARIISIVFTLLFVFCYGRFTNYSEDVIFSIWLISLYRITDALSDLHQGFFQQNFRLDIAGKLLFYRNLLIVLFFWITILTTRNLEFSLLILFGSSLIFILLFELPNLLKFDNYQLKEVVNRFSLGKTIVLMRENLPLFINGFLLIYIYNQPKYALGISGGQTIFNILFMPAFVLNLLMLFLRPLMTQIAIYLKNHDYNNFLTLQNKLFFLFSIISAMILVLSQYFGLFVLSIVFGLSLQDFQKSFMILMFGGVFSSFATIFDNLLTILRKQHLLLISYILAFISSVSLSDYLVKKYSIEGASWSFLISMIIWCSVSAVIYFYSIKGLKNRE